MQTRGFAGCVVLLCLLPAACSGFTERTGSSAEPPSRSLQGLKDAAAGERDDVVGVITSVAGVQSICTGLVIDARLVLTAEHCLASTAHGEVAIDCANAALPSIDPSVQAWVVPGASLRDAASAPYVAVSNVRALAGVQRLCGDDIALLELSRPLMPSSPLALTASVPAAGGQFVAVGYGTDGAVDGLQRQNPAALIVCEGDACSDGRIASNELLANSGACAGDSGSPAIDESGRAFAMAVRSSSDCSETAYLQFATHLRWVAMNASEVASADGRAPAEWANDVLKPNDAADAGAGSDDGAAHSRAGGCTCTLQRDGARRASWGAVLLVALLACARRSSKLP